MSLSTSDTSPGVLLSNGCRITHGEGANVKKPFPQIPVVMHELNAGSISSTASSYRGQFGFIPFNHLLRLPRHVHISGTGSEKRLVAERIMVLNGAAMVELNGEIYLVSPGSLVDIRPGVPHTWTVCPSGVQLPDGYVTNGTFTMVYEYEEPTGFFPTQETRTLSDVNEYEPYEGPLDRIQFPSLPPQQVVEQATFVWHHDIHQERLQLGDVHTS